MSKTKTDRGDIYTRITDKIIADLSQGVRPWMRPWSADHAAGRISRPLRHNGIPYKGINVITRLSTIQHGLVQRLVFVHDWSSDGGQRCAR